MGSAVPDEPNPPPSSDPSTWLRLAGLVALLIIVAIDAISVEWNPDPWVHLAGIGLLVWGPRVATSGIRRG